LFTFLLKVEFRELKLLDKPGVMLACNLATLVVEGRRIMVQDWPWAKM
jgi:hypothetical protein